ncbi:MAG: UvrD-helicase domain-containing protein, partial [Lachnospiraceae bacterium]|nr:UvrD-helicase domain-containing protein [Lachnospiraceae bacterium]
MKWTKEQENVIKKRGGNLLVSAAAGSGKTAVLVQRIIEMIMDKERPVDIDKLLVVTFTKAAAAQMKERIQEAIERELKKNPANDHLIRQMSLIHKAQITTIHSFCLSVIRSHFHQVDLEPDFRMGDETEVELLKMEVVEEVFSEYYEKQDKGFLTLVESYGTLKSDKAVEDMVLTLYESAMSHMNPLQWLQEVKESFLVSSVSELREQPFMQYAYKECKELLLELEEYLEIAKEICNEPGGPTPYESVLKDDIAILRTVRGGNNLDEMKQALQEKKYTRIPKVDKTQVLEHKQNMVKEMREVYKKQLKQLEEGLLRYSEEEILMQIQNIREIAKTLVELTCKLYEGYKEKKKEGNLLDFGDLEHLAYEIVSKEGVAKEYQDYFYEIMIDEYQDSNFLQEGILKAISKEKIGQPNRFMVGDVKQSIYKFRMAKPEIFIEKYHTYEADLEAKATLIELNNNFRSRMSLLSGVNEIFEKIMRKELGNIDYDDRNSLKTGGNFPETDKLVGGDTELLLLDLSEEENRAEDEMLLEYSKKELEAQNVAERIKELVGGEQPQYVYDKKLGDYRKANYGDIVILLRAVSEWADVFSEVLLRNNIPAHTESKKGYFDTLEIKNILSMLTVIDNVYLDIPLVAVMRSKFGEFKGEELAAIKVFQKEEGYEELYFYDVLQLYVEKKENPLQKKIAAFLSQLEYFREIKHHYSIRELMEVILDRTNYLYFVSAM